MKGKVGVGWEGPIKGGWWEGPMYLRWVECPGALFIVLCSHDLTDITPEVGKHTETSRIELPWMDTHTTHTHTHTHTHST